MPAGPDSVIVSVPPCPFFARFSGLGVTVIVGVTCAVIITVAGLLLANWSLTINCATYAPATSAMNVGEIELGELSAAVLPFGRLTNDQANLVSGSLSASEEPLPSSFTVLPTITV